MIPLGLEEIAAVVGGTVTGDGGVTVTAPAVLDGRRAEPGGLFVAFAGQRTDGHDHADQAGRAGAVAALGSRPTALPTVVVPDVQAALQTLATHVVAGLRDRLTVVAVTGSQGKTSTKDLMAAVFSGIGPTVAAFGNLNNELGVPLTMLRVDATTRFLVLEMGARHVGDLAALTGLVAPDVAVVLNVGVAHLGEFGSQEAIARGKGELVRGLAPGGTAVLNADDPRVLAMRGLTDGPVVTFGTGPADVRVLDVMLDRSGRPSFRLVDDDGSVPAALPLTGAHQALNAAAAVAAGRAAGVPLDRAVARLSAVTPAAGRLERHQLAGGATLLDDSYNANPDSTRAALDALAAVEGRRRIAVLGEMLELGGAGEAGHRSVGAYAAARADRVVAVGAGARPVADGAGPVAMRVADNDAAVDWLRAHVSEGDVVLVKASRGARLDEVAAALLDGSSTGISVFGCDAAEAARFRELAPLYGCRVRLFEEELSARTAGRAAGLRCVSVGHRTRIDRATLLALRGAGVEYLSTRSVGVNHIDGQAAAELGLSIGNVDYSPDSVADWTLMLMLMALRHAASVVRRTDAHDYRLGPRGRELRDLTVGVVGTGRIGSAVIDRLRGFGGPVLAHDCRPRAGIEHVPLEELLVRSDVVTLHAPLTPASHHLLDARRLGLLRPGAVVVNTGRGGLVDTEALVVALEAGRLGGAALDVVEGEEGVFYTDRRGTTVDHELLMRLQALPNVLISPHTAYYTEHALTDIVTNTLRTCRAFENGRTLA